MIRIIKTDPRALSEQICAARLKNYYRISSNSFRENYPFLNLEIQRHSIHDQRSQYINMQKLFKGCNYSWAETL